MEADYLADEKSRVRVFRALRFRVSQIRALRMRRLRNDFPCTDILIGRSLIAHVSSILKEKWDIARIYSVRAEKWALALITRRSDIVWNEWGVKLRNKRNGVKGIVLANGERNARFYRGVPLTALSMCLQGKGRVPRKAGEIFEK